MRALGILPVFAAMLISPVQGQSIVEQAEVGPIASGVPVQGDLGTGSFLLSDGTWLETWSFTVTVPSTISLDLFSTDFDTFASISLPDDTILASNDDCTPGDFQRSCLVGVPIGPGLYYAGVNTAPPGSGGNYSLLVTVTPVPEPFTASLVLLAGPFLVGRRRR